MPASMMSAPTGGRPKVIGRSMATVATVPMPGSTPTRVPTRAPSRQKPILYGLAATEKPRARFARSSLMTASCSYPGPQLERQLQQINEQCNAECRHDHCGDKAFDPAHFCGTEDRNHEGRKG